MEPVAPCHDAVATSCDASQVGIDEVAAVAADAEGACDGEAEGDG